VGAWDDRLLVEPRALKQIGQSSSSPPCWKNWSNSLATGGAPADSIAWA
jgi:hypothetical protein